MNSPKHLSQVLSFAAIGMLASPGWAQSTPAAPVAAPATAPATGPYKVLNTAVVGGMGSFDYVFADSEGRRLYIPRQSRVDVFDLDTLKPAGSIANTMGVHGAVVDPKSGHGFCSSNPIVMWDAKTLATIKTIPAPQGSRPDGILFEPSTQHVFIISHSAPNLTVIDAKDGSIVGTVDNLGMNDTVGAVEQGASDGNGHLYFDIEDQACVAVVDSKTLKVTNHYGLDGKTDGVAGLAMDAKNNILFVFGRTPSAAVILNAADGKVITSLPIGSGVDGAVFNPDTLEAFGSQGDGTLTVIKENSPTSFAVEQVVTTTQGAKTSTLDAKTGHILLIANGPAPAPAATPAATPAPAATTPATPAATPPANAAAAGARRGGGRGGRGGPAGPFEVVVVGK